MAIFTDQEMCGAMNICCHTIALYLIWDWLPSQRNYVHSDLIVEGNNKM